jgi:hypothetical protein
LLDVRIELADESPHYLFLRKSVTVHVQAEITFARRKFSIVRGINPVCWPDYFNGSGGSNVCDVETVFNDHLVVEKTRLLEPMAEVEKTSLPIEASIGPEWK